MERDDGVVSGIQAQSISYRLAEYPIRAYPQMVAGTGDEAPQGLLYARGYIYEGNPEVEV